MMTSQPVYEDAFSVLLDTVQAQREAQWAQADWIVHMGNLYGEDILPKLASELGCTTGKVRALMAAALAFPDSTRALDLPVEMHSACALTDHPEVWLQKVLAEGWSYKDLIREIHRENSRTTEIEMATRAAESVRRAVRRYNTRYAKLTGKTAQLTWIREQA